MRAIQYAVHLKKDPQGGYTVTFPDVPEAITEGDTLKEALQRAAEALEAALSFYIDADRDIPKAVAKGRMVGLPALSECKVLLYLSLRQEGVSRAELARRLGWQKSQITRILDLNHASRMEQIEEALGALGKEIVIQVVDAA